MNLCSYGHDEVCYDGRECPVCGEMEDIKIANCRIAELEQDISKLEDELEKETD